MKVMIRRNAAGVLSAYVPKKDLEEIIVSMEKPEMWGGSVTARIAADGSRHRAADHGRCAQVGRMRWRSRPSN